MRPLEQLTGLSISGRDARFIVFAMMMAALLVASEMASWPSQRPWADGRMLFGAYAPLLVGLLLTDRRQNLGLGWGDRKRGSIALAAGIPLAVLAVAVLSASDEVGGVYRRHPQGAWRLLIAYLPGILQVEVCFRGVLLFGLRDRMSQLAAAAVATLPYGLIHLDKPAAEAIGSIPVGFALAVIAGWTRSIWYGFALHLVGAIALTAFSRS